MSATATSYRSTPARVELAIGGMTCPSCAARIEKRLNKLEGITASVNFATEQATVATPEGVAVADLIGEVEAAGYTARVPTVPGTSTDGRDGTSGSRSVPGPTSRSSRQGWFWRRRTRAACSGSSSCRGRATAR